jgi:hypothetical protein
MKVNGKDYPIYYGKKMTETTNQIITKMVVSHKNYAIASRPGLASNVSAVKT